MPTNYIAKWAVEQQYDREWGDARLCARPSKENALGMPLFNNYNIPTVIVFINSKSEMMVADIQVIKHDSARLHHVKS